MPDPFFSQPKQRKRKRDVSFAATGRPAKAARSTALGKSHKANGVSAGPSKGKKKVDEELSDSADDGEDVDTMDLRASEGEQSSGEEDAAETPAEKRLRLARLYLEGVEKEARENAGDYDAAELDREIIGQRLRQDVAEGAGKVHLYLADSIAIDSVRIHNTRRQRAPVTAAVASEDGSALYTASKDGSITHFSLRTGACLQTIVKVRLPAGDRKGKRRADTSVEGHVDEIWTLALSGDGRTLASGGKDKVVGVWEVGEVDSHGKGKGKWRAGFGGHRDGITTMAFRRGTPTLYTGSLDRTLRVYSLALGASGFVEALFGHQDSVQHLDAGRTEVAVSVGGRDRTARWWKIADETQLVFRGGGRSRLREVLEGGAVDGDDDETAAVPGKRTRERRYVEGSLECVAMIDETTFVSGGDSGSIALWNTAKKKPVFSVPLTHGLHETHSATEGLVTSPRPITALGALRYADVFASGSWDGTIRLWKVERTLRSFSLLGEIAAPGVVNTLQLVRPPAGSGVGEEWAAAPDTDADAHPVNGVSGTGKPKPPVVLVAALAREPRLGRWLVLKEGVQNRAMVAVLSVR